MSITDRMENDGMTYEDAKMKESLTADAAPKCKSCYGPLGTGDPLTADCGGDCLLCMAEVGDPDACYAVARQMRPLQKRFAEHLAACRLRQQEEEIDMNFVLLIVLLCLPGTIWGKPPRNDPELY